MPKETQARPRLISLLTFLLLLQTPLLVFLGLNLLTNRWAFLTSWPIFWAELEAAFWLVTRYTGEYARDEVLLFDVIAFVILALSAAFTLIAGVTFHQGKAFTWILGLTAQIGVLVSGLGLYFLHRPVQSYWLLVIGIIMVLYLNYGDVYQWFLQTEISTEEGSHV